MARAIVRYSMNGSSGKGTRAEIRKFLTGLQFRSVGTATYESPDVDLKLALASMQKVLAILLSAGHLDHVWVYVDTASTDPSESN